jgi:hypothetical protein
MSSYSKRFADLKFQFEFCIDTRLSTDSHLTIPTRYLGAEYISNLVTHTYRQDIDIAQSVLDAISPYQMMSKAWAVEVLRHVWNKVVENEPGLRTMNVVHPGSWFGQLASMLKEDSYLGPKVIDQCLIDVDPQAIEVSAKCLRQYRSFFPEEHLDSLELFKAQDLFEAENLFVSTDAETANVVLWPGVEHFDKEKTRKFIRSSPKGTLFVLLGTDTVLDEHINPIAGPEQLVDWDEERANRHSLYFMGTMKCYFGSRHCVAFYVEPD